MYDLLIKELPKAFALTIAKKLEKITINWNAPILYYDVHAAFVTVVNEDFVELICNDQETEHLLQALPRDGEAAKSDTNVFQCENRFGDIIVDPINIFQRIPRILKKYEVLRKYGKFLTKTKYEEALNKTKDKSCISAEEVAKHVLISLSDLQTNMKQSKAATQLEQLTDITEFLLFKDAARGAQLTANNASASSAAPKKNLSLTIIEVLQTHMNNGATVKDCLIASMVNGFHQIITIQEQQLQEKKERDTRGLENRLKIIQAMA